MKIQTLISTMHRVDYSFLDKMNLEGSVVVINQCDKSDIDRVETNKYIAQIYSTPNRGLSNSRNEAILRCDADVFLTGDDDIIYRKGYSKLIEKIFKNHPSIDIIAFNINRFNMPDKMIIRKPIEKWQITKKNRFYPSVSLAYRKKSFEKANLHFHPLFGAGGKYLSGEESLVLLEARKAGLKIYECPKYIADVDCATSTWFKGYDEKYFFDKGAWLKCAYPKVGFLLKYYYLLKKNGSNLTRTQIIKQLSSGMKSFEQE